jgi:hypothetical protein
MENEMPEKEREIYVPVHQLLKSAMILRGRRANTV